MKKYNLSAICKAANGDMKTMNKSEAFKKAWKIEKTKVRISEIEDKRFELSMIDRWTPSQREYDTKLLNELQQLYKIVYTSQKPQIQKLMSDDEVIAILKKMSGIWNNPEPDWDEYDRLNDSIAIIGWDERDRILGLMETATKAA